MEEEQTNQTNGVHDLDEYVRPPDTVYREQLLPFGCGFGGQPFYYFGVNAPLPNHSNAEMEEETMGEDREYHGEHDDDENVHDDGTQPMTNENENENETQMDDLELALKESLEQVCFLESELLQKALEDSEKDYKTWLEKEKSEKMEGIMEIVPFLKKMKVLDAQNGNVYAQLLQTIERYENTYTNYEPLQICGNEYAAILHVLNNTRISLVQIEKLLGLFLVVD
jgi:hypothetical protein